MNFRIRKESAGKNADVLSAIFLFAIILIGFGFKTVIAFDPDEQLAFSQMYRVCRGQQYLTEISDAYQFSAVLMSPVYYLCEQLGRICLNPVILYRLFSILLSCLMNLRIGVAVYRRSGNRTLGVLAWMCMITALPKSILSLEHSNLSLIFLSWITADLLAEDDSRRKGILLGIDCSLLSLMLPPLVLLYVPVVLYYLFRKEYACALQIIIVSVLILAVIIVPVLLQGGVQALIQSISLILMDGSHQLSVAERISAFFSDLGFLAKYVAIYTVLFLIFLAIKKAVGWKRPDNLIVLSAIPFLVTSVQFILRPTSPMAGNGRYLLLMILCVILALNCHRDTAVRFSAWLYLIAFPVIYITSNTNLLSASGFLMIAPVLFILIHASQSGENQKEGFLFLKLIVITQCITMIMTWRTYGTLPHSIFHFDLQQDTKTLPGVWYDAEGISFFAELSEAKDDLTGEAAIVSSIYSYANNITEKEIGGPVTAATLVYNEQWKNYLEDHPFNSVDVIVCKYNNETIDELPLLTMLKEQYADCTLSEYETFRLYHYYK